MEAQQAQSKLVNEAYQNPKFRPKMDAIMRGFEGLQSQIPGSTTLDHLQFAFDETGYAANRVTTAMRLHANLFDTASPDQAAEIGAKLVQSAQEELATNPGMRAVGDTLEVAPDASQLLKAHWEGDELGQGDVAYLGVTAARELQRAVTPLEPDSTHPQLQWVEDATMWTLALWPGAASKVAEAIGLKTEVAQVDEIVAGWRGNMAMVEPKVEQPMQSLAGILGAAGIVVNDDNAYDAAFQVLQGSELAGVPVGLAQGIVATNELPADETPYYAGRIVETGGTAGNVKGLLAEIELAKRPTPVDPPAGQEPPPGGDPPPPAGTPGGEDPPGTEPKPPVDPPSDPDPDAGTGDPVDPPGDPVSDPAPDPDPDPVAGGPVDPPSDPDSDAGGDGEQVAALTGASPSAGQPMDPADFERLLAEVKAELDAEQGAHPVNDPAAGHAGHGH
jgi:hypothetical protein